MKKDHIIIFVKKLTDIPYLAEPVICAQHLSLVSALCAYECAAALEDAVWPVLVRDVELVVEADCSGLQVLLVRDAGGLHDGRHGVLNTMIKVCLTL